MADAWGTVTAVDGEHATIRIDAGGCGRCAEAGGCGGNSLGKLLCSSPDTFCVPNPERVTVGTRVCIVVADGSIGRSALHAYAIPLLAVLAGALSGSGLGGEVGAIGGASLGLIVGWLGLRRAQRCSQRDVRLRPSIRP
jgi:sigma-E factor negative regulatory protein RseC